MGVAGAAWATSVSQLVSFVVLLVLNRRCAAIKVKLSRFTPQLHYFYKIFTGGVPSLSRQGVGSIATVLLNLAAGNYGGASADAAIAAMGVVNRISMFANSALIGFGQGFQPVCGTNYGAGKRTRVRQAFYFCIRLGGGTVAALSVLGFAFAPQLIRLFRDDADVVVIGTAARTVPDAGADGLDHPVYDATANHRHGVASVGGGCRAAGIVFDSGRLCPAKAFGACGRGVCPARRGSAGLCAGTAYGAVRAEDVSQ